VKISRVHADHSGAGEAIKLFAECHRQGARWARTAGPGLQPRIPAALLVNTLQSGGGNQVAAHRSGAPDN